MEFFVKFGVKSHFNSYGTVKIAVIPVTMGIRGEGLALWWLDRSGRCFLFGFGRRNRGFCFSFGFRRCRGLDRNVSVGKCVLNLLPFDFRMSANGVSSAGVEYSAGVFFFGDSVKSISMGGSVDFLFLVSEVVF